MSRINLAADEPEVSLDEGLDVLIPMYATNKSEMDSYKKLCDSENAQIKAAMKDKFDTYTAGGYTAKYIVSTKETINEAKLLEVMKEFKVPGVIKTREYVDVDALEQVLYSLPISDELALAIDACRVKTEVVQLRITAEKKKKEK